MSTIYNEIKRLKFSFKKVYWIHKNKYTAINMDLCKLITREIVAAMSYNYHLIYFDETSFQMDISSKKAWSKKGTTNIIQKPTTNTSNYTVFACMDKDGIIGIQILKGYSKSVDCLGFLNSML